MNESNIEVAELTPSYGTYIIIVIQYNSFYIMRCDNNPSF